MINPLTEASTADDPGRWLRDQCWDSLTSRGDLAVDFLKVEQNQWENALRRVAAVIPGCHVVGKGDSHILISPERAFVEIRSNGV